MTGTVDLPEADLAILRRILHDHLPPDTDAWAFGSRVTGRARRYSDLDLALQSTAPLDPGRLAGLSEALSQSDLTIKVDLIDFLSATPAFREIIKSQMVRLP